MFPPGRERLATIPAPIGSVPFGKHDWYGFRHTLQRLSQKIAAARRDHIEFATDQFRCNLINPLEIPLRRPTLQYQVLALDVSKGT